MKVALLALGLAGSLAFTPATIEPHPHLRTAITELQAARNELRTAAHDFGGHRVEAIKAVDNAIRQLQIAEKYDNDNDRGRKRDRR